MLVLIYLHHIEDAHLTNTQRSKVKGQSSKVRAQVILLETIINDRHIMHPEVLQWIFVMHVRRHMTKCRGPLLLMEDQEYCVCMRPMATCTQQSNNQILLQISSQIYHRSDPNSFASYTEFVQVAAWVDRCSLTPRSGGGGRERTPGTH